MTGAWRLAAFGAALAVAVPFSVGLPPGPAQAAKAKPAAKGTSPAATIGAAVKLAKAGKHAKAAQMLSAAIDSGKLKSPDMARALHYRAVARRAQGQSAQAIADFTSALWLSNGLSSDLRADAKQQRAAVYREAGLASGPSSAKAGSAAATRPAPGANWQTDISAGKAPAAAKAVAAVKPKPKAKPSAGGGIGGFFSNLFGGGAEASKSAAVKVAKPSVPASVPPALVPKKPAQISSWTKNAGPPPPARRSAAVASAPKASVSPPRNAPKASPRKARAPTAGALKGRYRLVLSPLRSKAAASANAQKVKQQFASVLGPREAIVEPLILGNMGTFYRVRIGPFADTQTPQSICTKLKAGGVDCMLATR